MSGLVVGLVLRAPITSVFTSDAKFIATVYADHAWEDGTHAHPAVDTVATITGLSVRTVQRYLRILETIGMLIPSGKGPRGTNQYSFPLVEHEDGSVRLKVARGDTVTPRQPVTGDTESGDTESGDTAVSPKQTTHKNLVIVINTGEIAKKYEQEFGALTPMIADMIQDDCKTYPIDWIPEAMQIAVQANKRNWSYVRGILKRCKDKNVRPSLNRLENANGNTNPSTSNRSRTKPAGRAQETPAQGYSDADRAAAERVKANRSGAHV